jgi:lipoprotein NlpD
MPGHTACRVRALTALAILSVCGCTSRQPAPVSERSPAATAPVARPAPPVAAREPDVRPEFYTVKKGDTLYVIALDHGLDYKELAEWNQLDNPNRISVGQQLRLRAPPSVVATAPLRISPSIEARAIGSAPPPPPAAANDAVKSQPKAVKVPYSEQAFAQLSTQPQPQAQAQAQPQAKPPEPTVAKVEPRVDEKPAAPDDDDEKVDWGWPAGGKLLSTFNESTNLKGIGIAGKLGQAVAASAPGKVLYSGDGIRGYGKLVIVKHNKAYLSVYAHNSQLLVKEGQTVLKGQKIAEMGASDAVEVNLHFEIRRFGKPIDPLKLLPPDRPA